MRVRIQRRGGFAGLPAEGERADHELSAEERHALESLLVSPPQEKRKPAGADRFCYHVAIEHEGQTRQFELSEEDMPDPLANIARTRL
ncbi:MAG TPA: protealysin inhibitor emfourin [Dongiaceae bacterium]|jgi:hypothetical protein|nr:protealysin inhibitor emfourin [Dongiaceae bacterium]